ncbi:MAG: beta-N-acetylhexosaminidase [Sphingomonadales bacterium]
MHQPQGAGPGLSGGCPLRKEGIFIASSPVIFSPEGLKLTRDERAFFRESSPYGLILFARNIKDPDQVAGLIADVKDLLGRDNMAIFVDQEGGRVQRLGPPHWRPAPAMAPFGALYADDPGLAKEALFLNIQLIGLELKALGFTVDCLPVIDVPIPGADNIIGDRAFSEDPEIVAALGRVAIDALMSVGILPVIKHIPGHGRAGVDSHKALPLVATPKVDLMTNDFLPFQRLKDCPFAMTAHVVYQDIDRDGPATFSKKIVEEVIRGDIGFENFLISDDLTMRALYGSFRKRAEMTLGAGVDLVLHCSGNLREMEEVMAGVSAMAPGKESRLASLLEMPQKGDGPVTGEVLERYQEIAGKLK